MSFFTSGIFWFAEGIFFCLFLAGLKAWADDRHLKIPIWKWLLVVLWLLLTGFTIAFIGTCIGEREMDAAVKGGSIFSAAAIVSGILLWRFIARKPGQQEPAVESPDAES